MSKKTTKRRGRGIKDISGQRFGNLVAIVPTPYRKRGSVIWECRCDCGSTCYIPSSKLMNGNTTCCSYCWSNPKRLPTYVKKDAVIDEVVPISAIYDGNVPYKIEDNRWSFLNLCCIIIALAWVVVGQSKEDPSEMLACMGTALTFSVACGITFTLIDKVFGD